MRVLVLGASGFIGNGAAKALVRGGHQVLGQTRSTSHLPAFESEEIELVESDPVKDDRWLEYVENVDVILDALEGSAPVDKLALQLIRKVESRVSNRHPTAAKLVYILTSGTWVHGDDRINVATEGVKLDKAAALVEWRPAVETYLTKSSHLVGIVVRPALLYGKGGSITAALFQQARSGVIHWPGIPGGRYLLVHIDNLSDLFLRCVERHPLVESLKIDASNPTTESVDLLFNQLGKIAGISEDKISYKAPECPFEAALTGTAIVRPTLALSLLGWQPRKPSLIDGLSIYLRAALAQPR